MVMAVGDPQAVQGAPSTAHCASAEGSGSLEVKTSPAQSGTSSIPALTGIALGVLCIT